LQQAFSPQSVVVSHVSKHPPLPPLPKAWEGGGGGRGSCMCRRRHTWSQTQWWCAIRHVSALCHLISTGQPLPLPLPLPPPPPPLPPPLFRVTVLAAGLVEKGQVPLWMGQATMMEDSVTTPILPLPMHRCCVAVCCGVSGGVAVCRWRVVWQPLLCRC